MRSRNSLLDDVAAGTYDLTWTAQRPWPARGNKAFDALVAPFLIDSYDLERSVLEDPIAQQMIASVHGPVWSASASCPARSGSSRRTIRCVKPSDLANAVVGIDDTWVGDETVKALGGTTASRRTTTSTPLTGAVAQLGAIANNRWFTELPSVAAGIPFWPRPVIVVMNQARYRAADRRPAPLAARRRHDVHRATGRTARDRRSTARSSRSAPPPASRTPRPTTGRRSATAAAPVYEQLDRDPATASFIAAHRRVEGDRAPQTPPACDVAVAGGSPVDRASAFPTARIGSRSRSEEIQAWVQRQRRSGRCRYPVPSRGLPVRVSRSRSTGPTWSPRTVTRGRSATSAATTSRSATTVGTYGFRWSFADGKLSLTDITGGAWDDAEVWTIKPWVQDR